MNSIKNIFSIKDLENLSGIKAHTIRIWEKRYNVLEPMRTDSNIRYYDVTGLQKLLNITLLHNHGYKISKISKFPNHRIPELVNEILSKKNAKLHAINAFKMAMMNFDQKMFLDTYSKLLSEKSFHDVFYEVIIPLMEEIGQLWQTNTITPAHEHFISYLIKLKLLSNTEKIHAAEPIMTDRVFVLLLPYNEVHELGLMYINYEIISKGYKSIFLGQSVPVESLGDIRKYFDNIIYITYATCEPAKSEMPAYIERMQNEILDANARLWLIGKNTENLDPGNFSQQVQIFHSIPDLLDEL